MRWADRDLSVTQGFTLHTRVCPDRPPPPDLSPEEKVIRAANRIRQESASPAAPEGVD
ncbi:hypothetical protein [Streptomyces morookaense]|uniref:Uncharacterized protein n=1 Tax=Streptomyces morookaense TaxID=1970 RepID=A0A7Y7B3Z5_STRMO|nr:hypothetical protein [Streptomyces morookaense]NVK78583.1 hypothetical protein [Streptomyces morookaense]GHF33550.1 hypothetical protein GCM10010359_40340 [Streptomyces morookaense]